MSLRDFTKNLIAKCWWPLSVVPATWEVDTGEFSVPRGSRTTWSV